MQAQTTSMNGGLAAEGDVPGASPSRRLGSHSRADSPQPRLNLDNVVKAAPVDLRPAGPHPSTRSIRIGRSKGAGA